MSSHVERYDAETEADIAGWVPAERADEYRAARRRILARQFALLADESRKANEGLARVARQINDSIERISRRAKRTQRWTR